MYVLLLAVLLLFVAPATLLLIGRLIVSRTDKPAFAAMKSREAVLSGRASERAPGEKPWYERPMQPAFSKASSSD